jgi:hypothetical protein
VVLSLLTLSALGCSSSSKSAGATATTVKTPATTAAPATATTVAPAAGGLSGTWSGQYSGASDGTFVLTWQQSGSTLSGNIKLSDPATTLTITGTVNGNDIQFGTLASLGVSYTGTLSGDSMSGNWTAPGGGGTWSGTKTS